MTAGSISRCALLQASVVGILAATVAAPAIARPGAGAPNVPSLGRLKQIKTELLDIGYVEAGPSNGRPVILLHAWPYDIHTYVGVAPILAAAGYRVIVPLSTRLRHHPLPVPTVSCAGFSGCSRSQEMDPNAGCGEAFARRRNFQYVPNVPLIGRGLPNHPAACPPAFIKEMENGPIWLIELRSGIIAIIATRATAGVRAAGIAGARGTPRAPTLPSSRMRVSAEAQGARAAGARAGRSATGSAAIIISGRTGGRASEANAMSARAAKRAERASRTAGGQPNSAIPPPGDYSPYGDERRYYRSRYDEDDGDRGFFDRAGDEVRSWFGDRDARRRHEQGHRGRGPKNDARSDECIREEVNDRPTEDVWIDASEVEVAVEAGKVTLSGVVGQSSN